VDLSAGPPRLDDDWSDLSALVTAVSSLHAHSIISSIICAEMLCSSASSKICSWCFPKLGSNTLRVRFGVCFGSLFRGFVSGFVPGSVSGVCFGVLVVDLSSL